MHKKSFDVFEYCQLNIEGSQNILMNYYSGKDVVIGGDGTVSNSGSLYVNHELKTNKSAYLAVQSGKVGIGTDNPATSLQLNGTLTFGGSSNITCNTWAVRISAPLGTMWMTSDATNAGNYLGIGLTNGGLFLMQSNVNSGNGNYKYPFKVDEEGKVTCTELTVQEVSGADFVFDDNYQLRSIAELERFIQQHKHLPDIPPASEVEKNGIKIGEMNTLLLRKIEELTLYIIELKKELEALKK